jgi:hypothetical protein
MTAARGALVISWGEPRPGVPNDKGMEVFADALGFYDGLMKTGRISGYRVYASASRSFGLLIVEGDTTALAQLMAEPESQKHLALGGAVVQNINVELMNGGSPDDVAQFYATQIAALAEIGLTTG